MAQTDGDSEIAAIFTRYGRPATAALRTVIAEIKGEDPLAPVTVLVANNFVGIAARRSLAVGSHGAVVQGCAGLAAVSFLTVYRLAELLGSPALARESRRPVSTPLVAAAVRRVLATDPGVFEPVARHRTTERRLVAAHRELSGLEPQSLERLAALGPRPSDVVRIHRAVQRILAPRWYTEQDLLTAACGAVGDANSVARDMGDIVIHLPQDLTPGRAELLRGLAVHRSTTAIIAMTGVGEADATVVRTLARLGVRAATAASGARQSGEPEPDVRITSVSDADDEARHVARAVVQAAREGVPFDRMAVVFAAEDPYGRLVQDHLDAAEVPYNGAAVTGLADSASGRLLTRLLALGHRDFRRDDVAALLAGSPLRWKGRTVPSRAWDQISRRAGIVRGRSDWAKKLAAYAEHRTAEIERIAGSPDHEWRERALLREVDLAVGLASFVDELGAELDRGQSRQGWRSLSLWAQGLLRTYSGEQREWPESERRAGERLHSLLDRLAGLDSVEPDPEEGVFERTLHLELEGGLGRVGSFGNGVLVGHAWMCLGIELDRVWILGLSEGSFPSRSREDSLLPDRERSVAGALNLNSERLGNEHRHFLAAIAAVAPGGEAHLLRPRGDLRQSLERAPSRWLVGLAEARCGRRLAGSEVDDLDETWLRHVPSFAAGMLASTFPPTKQEYEVRSLLDELETTATVDGHRLLQSGGAVALGATSQASRADSSFTRFDGNLAGVGVPHPSATSRPTSATALETYADCPFQYFVRNLLGVYPLETPERRMRIEPLQRGILVHAILERFVAERLGAETPAFGWSGHDRSRLHEIAEEEFTRAAALGLTGERLYWKREQVLLRRDLDAFWELDSERRNAGRLRPLATELGFGLRGEPPVLLDIDGQHTVALRGSIDLVDQDEQGNLVVVDYKTGRETKLTAQDPHKSGTRLQLVLYAAAAKAVLHRPQADVASFYWHLRAASKYCQVGYGVTPDIVESTMAAVGTIVANIAAGVFVQHPTESTRTQWVGCHYCDPDGLGVSESRRRLIRKSAAPELADYLALVEPALLAQPNLPHPDEDPL